MKIYFADLLMFVRRKSSVTTILVLFLFASINLYAQRGKDGNKTVTAANTIVNDYTILTSDAASGATTINVASSILNGSGYFAANLAPGDLILIIQMQGATITTANDPTYGTISSYNNCGNNEFAEVSSVPSATSITLDCGLKNNYTSAGKVQIVRVPRFNSLTINSAAVLTAQTWNGSSGGVVAVEVLGSTVINSGGKIDGSGKGFRGGALDNQAQFGTWDYTWSTAVSGAEKGESIAGSQSDYDAITGRYDRGAAANGGGGGDAHNAGGGGGANAGDINLWNGQGNPDVSTANMIAAWNLESPPLASSSSSGGGRGGYTYGPNNGDPTVTAPGNSSWGGDNRRPVGGLGGRPLDYSTGRFFLGGGGGAGDQNESKGTAGTNGGGIVYLVTYSDVSGTGSIISNGVDVPITGSSASDGCGGAGAGGTVIVNAQGPIGGVTINANGGKGGTQNIYNLLNYRYEAEGPGGGGGGGYIAVSNGTPTRTADGGLNGTTNSGAISAKFPPNGATIGAAGLPNQSINNFYLQVSNTDTICWGSSATLTASASGTPPVGITYYWYTTSTGGTPVGSGNTFTTPLLYSSATYYVGSCPGTYRLPVQVILDVVSASFYYTGGCLGQPLNFVSTTSSSLGTVSTYSWDFGDGNTSALPNPSHTYLSAGTYTNTLTVTDSRLCSTVAAWTATVYPKATAGFSANITSGCVSLPVSFTNTSTNGNTYSWVFGDAGSSSATSPTYTYTTPGTYTVKLVAMTSNSCNDSLIKTAYIIVNPKPLVAFNASNVCLGDPSVFSNNSTGATSYSWNFGDGNTSTATNPSHTYLSANTYTVTLVATNSFNCKDSVTQSVIVNNAPVVSFTANGPTTACGSLNVTFVNNTTGGVGNTYSWTFGDGATSTSQNPSHIYAPGTYTVKLSATLGSCIDVDSIVKYIVVNPKPIVAFNNNTACVGDPSNFNNNSTGGTGYSWNFGDGNSSTATNPSHTYLSANTYTVTLVVTNSYNCKDSVTQPVIVNNAPIVSFTTNGPTTGCGSLTVTFVNNTTGGAGNIYSWTFGDGGTSTSQNPSHTYSPGTYTVKLSASLGSCNDADSIIKYIVVNSLPVSAFSANNVCFKDTVIFNNTSTGATGYTWKFGDGFTSSTTNPTHLYSAPGSYTVTLIAISGACQDSTTHTIVVNPGPTANFSAAPLSACDSLAVTFTNTSTGATSYSWDFGDTYSSTATAPTHTYNVPGTYSVILTATAGNCSATKTLSNIITIWETPKATVSVPKNLVCINNCTDFTSVTTGSPTSWSWTFTGASITNSTDTNPSNVCYYLTGSYNVSLTVSNAHCSSSQTLTNYIYVDECTPPHASFLSNDTILCGPGCVNFTSTASNINTYEWHFQGGTPDTSSVANPSNICYTTLGTYDVTMIVTNNFSADTLRMTKFINVVNPPTAPTFTRNGNLLTSSLAASYQWYFNGSIIPGATSQSYLATQFGNYSVTITDANGCSATSTVAFIDVGVQELNDNDLFSIYPNPFNQTLNLLIQNSFTGNANLKIADAIGQIVFEKEIKVTGKPSILTFDVSDLANGVYIVTLETEKFNVVRRVVKQ